MSTGGEAGVPLDVDGTGTALPQQLHPLVSLVRRLADGEDLLDQRPRNLKSVLNAFGVGQARCVDAGDGNVAFELERRHPLTHAENQQVLMQEDEVTVLVL